MFINYLVHDFLEFLVVYELAFIHGRSWAKLMVMNKVIVYEHNNDVLEYSWAVHEHVDKSSWTFIF